MANQTARTFYKHLSFYFKFFVLYLNHKIRIIIAMWGEHLLVKVRIIKTVSNCHVWMIIKYLKGSNFQNSLKASLTVLLFHHLLKEIHMHACVCVCVTRYKMDIWGISSQLSLGAKKDHTFEGERTKFSITRNSEILRKHSFEKGKRIVSGLVKQKCNSKSNILLKEELSHVFYFIIYILPCWILNWIQFKVITCIYNIVLRIGEK